METQSLTPAASHMPSDYPPSPHRGPTRGFQALRSAAQKSRSPLLSRLVPHRDRARAEFLSAHELQVDKLRQSVEQLRPSADYPRVDDEFVLIDQPQLCQRQR